MPVCPENEYTYPLPFWFFFPACIPFRFVPVCNRVAGVFRQLTKPKPLVLKLSAILLLCVFTWSQYAKQAIYLECKMANTFKSFAVKCDCETIAGLDNPGSPNIPLSNTHSHTHLDELFPVPNVHTVDFSFPTRLQQMKHPENEDDCSGNYNSPFHPPKA